MLVDPPDSALGGAAPARRGVCGNNRPVEAFRLTRISASKSPLLIIALAVLVSGALLPFGGAQTPLVDVSLGFSYSEDFNADDGAWTTSGPRGAERPTHTGVWQWGAPTSGPGFAASGSNVWATNLAGTYDRYDCAAIMSPPIDLTGAASASFSVAQWRHMAKFSGTTGWLYDAGMFFVTSDDGATLTPIDPVQGTDGPLSTYSARCMDGATSHSSTGQRGIGGPVGSAPPAAVYEPLGADLSPFVGQSVRVVIAFGSDCCTHYAGWYVDDFAVTVDGVTAVEDFEASDGGFTLVSTYQENVLSNWEWGVPTGGPKGDNAMWGTNIDGLYGSGECASLESPHIQVGDVNDEGLGIMRAHLTWNQWYRSNSLYAAGLVMVDAGDGWTVLEPEGGYPGTTSGSQQEGLLACLGVAADQRVFSGLHSSTSEGLKPFRADLSAYAGQEVRVRFLFASTWSVFNPTVYDGWYIDDVEVETRVSVDGVDIEPIVEMITERLPTSGNPMPPGWTQGGTESSWAYGTVTTVGPEGETAVATNLGGNYGYAECSYAETPTVPGAVFALNPTLVVDHWYDIYSSSAGTYAWSGGAILVSTDDGATWSYVQTDAYDLNSRYADVDTCLSQWADDVPTDSAVFSGAHEYFDTDVIDLSAYADAPTVKVRFVLASGISIGREGWYLRSVDLGGVSVL